MLKILILGILIGLQSLSSAHACSITNAPRQYDYVERNLRHPKDAEWIAVGELLGVEKIDARSICDKYWKAKIRIDRLLKGENISPEVEATVREYMGSKINLEKGTRFFVVARMDSAKKIKIDASMMPKTGSFEENALLSISIIPPSEISLEKVRGIYKKYMESEAKDLLSCYKLEESGRFSKCIEQFSNDPSPFFAQIFWTQADILSSVKYCSRLASTSFTKTYHHCLVNLSYQMAISDSKKAKEFCATLSGDAARYCRGSISSGEWFSKRIQMIE